MATGNTSTHKDKEEERIQKNKLSARIANQNGQRWNKINASLQQMRENAPFGLETTTNQPMETDPDYIRKSNQCDEAKRK